MLVALVPLLVAVIGALAYGLAEGKTSELGRLAYVVGLFWLVWTMAGKALHVG